MNYAQDSWMLRNMKLMNTIVSKTGIRCDRGWTRNFPTLVWRVQSYSKVSVELESLKWLLMLENWRTWQQKKLQPGQGLVNACDGKIIKFGWLRISSLNMFNLRFCLHRFGFPGNLFTKLATRILIYDSSEFSRLGFCKPHWCWFLNSRKLLQVKSFRINRSPNSDLLETL